MTKTERDAKIAEARRQVAAAVAIEDAFKTAFPNGLDDSDEAEAIGNAWNAAHDMVTTLSGAESRIHSDFFFDQIRESGEFETYKLAAANID